MLAHDRLSREESSSALLLLPNKLSENDLCFPSKYPGCKPKMFHAHSSGFQEVPSFTSRSSVSLSHSENEIRKKNVEKASYTTPLQTICTVPDLDVVEVSHFLKG